MAKRNNLTNNLLKTQIKNNFSYFSKNNRTFLDSTSFTLIHDEIINALKNFYSSSGTKYKIGLNTGSFLSTQTIESTREKLKKFLHYSKGHVIFTPNRPDSIIIILHSLHYSFSNLNIFSYSGLDHDLWIPSFQYARLNDLKFISLPFYSNDKELITFLIENENLYSNSKNNLILLPFRSIGNGFELSLTTLKKLKNDFGFIIALDFTYCVGTKKYILDDIDFDFAFMDSNIGIGGPEGQCIFLSNFDIYPIMRPYLSIGNNAVYKVTNKDYSLEEDVSRFETGINTSTIVGLSKALDILVDYNIEEIQSKINEIKNYFLGKIRSRFPDIIIIGSGIDADYHNIIGFIFPNINMHEIAMYLDETKNIDIRSGSFCAHQLIKQIYSRYNSEITKNSMFGIIQLSLHYYNNEHDIDLLIEGISQFLEIIK